MMRLNARQLRKISPQTSREASSSVPRRPIALILENIYDTYNIGGLFRLADALAAEQIYLCGETETPPNPRIHKASCGTYKVVPWRYCQTTHEAITHFRSSHQQDAPPLSTYPYVIGIEQSEDAVPYQTHTYTLPLALVVGNETTGLSKDTMGSCDKLVEIPMGGINRSLNVIVSAAIVSYRAIGRLDG